MFAEETENHPRQHFSFTRRQRFQAVPQHGDFCLTLPMGTVPLQCEMDSIQLDPDREMVVRNSTAPAFMARTVIGMSAWAVMKMMGM
jgi:hypothetical protein